MKYLSLFILLVTLSLSWRAVHEPRSLSESLHLDLQEDVRRIITDYVKTKSPDSEDLRIERLWTKELRPNKVRVDITYSYLDTAATGSEARVTIDGYTILEKSFEDDEQETWTFDKLHVHQNNIEFSEAITITPLSN